jgi:hypothetical protein
MLLDRCAMLFVGCNCDSDIDIALVDWHCEYNLFVQRIRLVIVAGNNSE